MKQYEDKIIELIRLLNQRIDTLADGIKLLHEMLRTDHERTNILSEQLAVVRKLIDKLAKSVK